MSSIVSNKSELRKELEEEFLRMIAHNEEMKAYSEDSLHTPQRLSVNQQLRSQALALAMEYYKGNPEAVTKSQILDTAEDFYKFLTT
jgi:hypothetical protein